MSCRNLFAAAMISLAVMSACIFAQTPAPAAVELTSQADHKRMMDLLKITAIRQGANGNNPSAPNAANYDESKVPTYPPLPDPLVTLDGKPVTTAQMWWEKRRPEIVAQFDREIYGRMPSDTPKVKWEVTSTTKETVFDIPVVVKKLVGHVDNSACPAITVDIQLTVTTPASAKGPVPVMMEFGFGGFGPRPGGPGAASKAATKPATKAIPKAIPKGGFPGMAGPFGQQLLLAKGWGYASVVANSIQPDNGAGLTKGIIGLCNKGQPRDLEAWGALKAWGWGASRALDYLETDKDVDAKHVGITGHSRYGKAALVTLAYDPRFAIGYISSSGAGGAKIHRRVYGELVENVAASGEYHWMAGNYIKYAGPLTPNDLPVDSHELIALCAPRPMFIGAGTVVNGDGWVDAKGMFLAAVGAGPVYKLLNKKDLGATEFPPLETTLAHGDVAFRQHKGGHTPGPNWPAFLTFAERYMVTVPPK